MRPLRRPRLLTVILSLCAMLFAQLALAGYACPAGTRSAEVAAMAQAGMPCAETMSRAMDEEQPGLCHAHCQAAQQTADTYQLPAFAASTQLGSVLVVERPALSEVVRAPERPRPHASPPLVIVNCCFRI